MLLQHYYSTLDSAWQTAFSQDRTRQRAIQHALALPCLLGRHTISQTISALGGNDRDWSSHYKMYSRSDWDTDKLFDPVIDEYLERFPNRPLVAAMDDTKLRKTGRKIPGASYHRDPLSPPFHLNLVYGLRFLQISILFPHYKEGDFPPRGIPVRFTHAPPLKKPGKRASDEARAQYNDLKKVKNLSAQTLDVIRSLRASIDQRGGSDTKLLMVGDASFANKTIFKAELDRTDVIARCRKDARLCFPAPAGSRRKYDPTIFTPEEVRKRDTNWRFAFVYLGGKHRRIRFKEVEGVLWKRGAGRRKLRLIVIAPVPYKLSKNSRTNYREPAYFLSTDLESPIKLLIQACFDRWQIEVNHRDEKTLLGVGQAQVRNPRSIPRHPGLAVASYALLLIAALQCHGPGRTDDYQPHPKWRKPSKRPSFLDIQTQLRTSCTEASVSSPLPQNFAKNLFSFADT